MEKAYYETPGPSSDPKVLKKMMRHKNDSTWIGVTLTTWAMPPQQPGPVQTVDK